MINTNNHISYFLPTFICSKNLVPIQPIQLRLSKNLVPIQLIQTIQLRLSSENHKLIIAYCHACIDILYTLDSASLLVKLKPRIFQRFPPFE
jgi:hypothetical protein